MSALHLDALVAVGAVVDDGKRLLETGPPDADDVGDQLTDGDDHLGRIETKDKKRHQRQGRSGRPRHPTKRHGEDVYLQVRPDERPAACVVEVAFHEEVEEVGGVAADGAQLGVAALEDLVAQGGAHVGAAVEEGAGELEGGRRGGGLPSGHVTHTVRFKRTCAAFTL